MICYYISSGYIFYVFADYLKAARRSLDCTTTGLVTSLTVAETCSSTEDSSVKMTANVFGLTVPLDYDTQPEHSSVRKFQARIVSELQILSCFVI